MISPNEILKGCVLCFEGKAQIVKGLAEYVMFEGKKEWVGGSLINGEPISEVWIEKLGFDKYDADEFFRQSDMMNWGIRVSKIFTGDWVVFQGFANQWHELRRIEYVHQLQVLYFAVTGEYLKVPKIK